MTKIARFLVVVAIVGMLVLAIWGLLTASKAPDAVSASRVIGLHAGNRAPDFALIAPDGKLVHLSDYQGMPVVLLFSSTDCLNCQTQVTEVQKLYAKLQAAHHTFALVGVDTQDTAGDVMQYDPQTDIAYPVLLKQDTRVSDLYQVRGTPTTFFLDRKGIIHEVIEGELDMATLQHHIELLGV